MSLSAWRRRRDKAGERARSRRPARRPRAVLEVERCEDRTLLATLVGATASGQLIQFDSDDPSTITSSTAITGFGVGENLLGMDFRPANGLLYALTGDAGNVGRLYTIDTTTGAATLAATLAADPADLTNPYTGLSGASFGVDFNPVPDRLRVVSDAGQDLRINVANGLAITDADLNPGTPNVVGVAYLNSFAGATSTTLYDIDSTTDQLFIQNPPSNGTLVPVGSLGVDTSDVVGFDILTTGDLAAPKNQAFAALQVGGSTGLYTIDLATGAATLVGPIGDGTAGLLGLSAVPQPNLLVTAANAFGVDTANNLVRFNTQTPGTILSSTPITGLQMGESILGIDVRPATGQLYALGSTSRLYTIDTTTGAATEVGSGPFTPALDGTEFGFDFNPVPDRIRVVSNTGQDLRLHPDTGAVAAVDGTLAYAAGDPNEGMTPNVVGAAYINSFLGATATTLYDIDSGLDVLVIQNPPNSGVLNTVGPLGVDASDVLEFDIRPGLNTAFAVLVVGGTPGLYSIDLATGAASLIGAIGGGTTLRGFALASNGVLRFQTTTATATEGGGSILLTVERVGGSDGTVTVDLTAAGSAGLGVDYMLSATTLTFGPGVTSQTVMLTPIDDAFAEDLEFAVLTLANATGGAIIGAPTTARVTIVDDEVPPANAFGVDGSGNLVRFNLAAPGTSVSSTPINGLQLGETILGLDVRPADGRIYALGSAGRLYTIDPATGAATLASTLEADPTDLTSPFTGLVGTSFGVDFNPVPDRLRVVSNTGQNLRINVDTGLVITDGDLNPGTPSVVGAAYINSFAGAGSTTLYVIDSTTDQLFIQNPPNNGTLVLVGDLGVDATSVVGFDVRTASGQNFAYATLVVGGVTGLYSIDLATGTATFIGDASADLVGLAIAGPGFTATLVAGTATFTGTDAADVLVIDGAIGLLRHNRFDAGDAGFNSPFDFDSTQPGDQTIAAADPMASVVVNTLGGDDSVTIGGASAPASGLAPSFAIDGGTGTNSLTIDDSAGTVGVMATISPTEVQGIGGTVGYSNVATLRIHGGSGGDTFTVAGTSAATSLDAGDGDDTVAFNDGATLSGGTLDGGDGTDTLDYSAYTTSVEVNLALVTATGTGGVAGFANATGGSAGDLLTGDSGANVLRGGPGNDTLVGGPGADQLFGDEGDDLLVWNNGDGSDLMEGGDGFDTVQVNGSDAAGDQFLIQVDPNDPTRLRFDRTNLGTFSLDIGTTEALDFNTLGGDDTLTVDFAGGNPIPPGGIDYDGGLGDDRLVLRRSGGTYVAANESYVATGPGAGSISFDGSVITFSNLTPIDDTVPAVNFSFAAPAGSQAVNVVNGPTVGVDATAQINGPGFELINLANKANVAVSTQASSDALVLNLTAAPAGLATLALDAGGGGDTLTVTAIPAGVATSASLGDGNDTANVVASGIPAGSTLILDGGPGADTLNVNSAGLAFDFSTPGLILFANGAAIAYSNFEQINITELTGTPPVLQQPPLLPIGAIEGQQRIDVVVATFTDPLSRPAGAFRATIDWGDGTTSAATIRANGAIPGVYDVVGSHLYVDEGTYAISVQVATDSTSSSTTVVGGVPITVDQGASQTEPTQTATATVAEAPVSALGASISTVEGQAFSGVVATFTSADVDLAAGDYTATIDWGDGTTSAGVVSLSGQVFSVSGSHTYADPGRYLITVAIEGNGTPVGSAFGQAEVRDAPLAPVSFNTLALTAGTPSPDVQLVTFLDAGGAEAADRYEALINWGDGTPATPGRLVRIDGTDQFEVRGAHTFARPGTFDGSVLIRSFDGSVLTIPFGATVAAPTLAIATLTPTEEVPLVDAIVATLGSPATAPQGASYVATIDWGDGTTSPGRVDADGNVRGSHTYDESGNYTLRVTVGTAEIPGLVSASGTVAVADVPIVLTGILDPRSDSGLSNSDRITNINTPTFRGTSEAGSTVRVFAVSTADPNQITALGQTAAGPDGSWSLTSAVALADGSYRIVATAIDRNNVTSATTEILGGAGSAPLVIDTVGPIVTDLLFNRFAGRLLVNLADDRSGLDQLTLVDNANYSITRPHTAPGRLLITGLVASAADAPTDVQTVTAVINGGQGLRGGTYTVTIRSGGIQDVAGNALDGEFYGFFPSGNNRPGGDFVAVIDSVHNVVFAPLPSQGFGTPNNPPGTPGSSFTLPPGQGRIQGSKLRLKTIADLQAQGRTRLARYLMNRYAREVQPAARGPLR